MIFLINEVIALFAWAIGTAVRLANWAIWTAFNLVTWLAPYLWKAFVWVCKQLFLMVCWIARRIVAFINKKRAERRKELSLSAANEVEQTDGNNSIRHPLLAQGCPEIEFF